MRTPIFERYRRRPGPWSAATAILIVILLCAFFQPTWETNDDVGMAMIAHGYGAAAFASPHLVFSNVLWGHFISTVPSVNGIVGYSIVTLGVLVAAGAGIFYGLLMSGCAAINGLLIILLLLVRATLFPQFTINSGLLTVASIVLVVGYQRQGAMHLLVIAGLLAFVAFLVRWLEFAFVLAVALPLLPLRELSRIRAVRVAACALALALGSATYADYATYQGSEWRDFNDLNSVRVAYTDYRVGERLKKRPDILEQYGHSANDIDLISTFFFLDPQVADTAVLRSMAADLGPNSDPHQLLANGKAAFTVLLSPQLLPYVAAAVLLGLLFPSSRVLLAWLVFLTAICAFGLLGRPGVMRIYFAPLALLVIAPILTRSPIEWRVRVGQIILGAACLVTGYFVISQSILSGSQMDKIRTELKQLPDSPIIAWGATFPFSLAYPVLSSPPALRIYSLGSFTRAPHSTFSEAERQGRGMLDRIKSGEAVYVSSSKSSMDAFGRYCAARLRGALEILSPPDRTLFIYKIRCKPSRAGDHLKG